MFVCVFVHMTAYDMLISDWGSVVCSSALACSLFYTSVTTSAPKVVLYSHRSCLLNAMLISLGLELNTDETLMPVVPLFHANGWGFGHIAPMLGKRLVLPGPGPDPASLLDRQSVVSGKSVSVRVDLVRRRILKKQKNKTKTCQTPY